MSQQSSRTSAPFRVDRNARDDAEFRRLVEMAENNGRTTEGVEGTPTGSSFHEGVAAAVRWMHGGAPPYTMPAPSTAEAPPSAAQRKGPTGVGAPPVMAGGGGTGTTGTGGAAS